MPPCPFFENAAVREAKSTCFQSRKQVRGAVFGFGRGKLPIPLFNPSANHDDRKHSDYLPIQQHGDMMYTAVLYLFYLPKQEPYFILKAHQVKKQHRTFFQQRRFVFPFFFDLYNTSTLQPQTLQPDCYATLWECMWINAHKKNCI